MENNDYTALDYFLPKLLNEDDSAAAPAGAAPAPGPITNPPAESTVAAVTDPVPAWLSDGIKYWEAELAKNPESKEVKAELERMKGMLPKAAVKEGYTPEDQLVKDMISDITAVERDVKEIREALVKREFDKVTVAGIETPMNALNDLRKQLGGQTWYDMAKKVNQ